jgi:hypothetical protein
VLSSRGVAGASATGLNCIVTWRNERFKDGSTTGKVTFMQLKGRVLKTAVPRVMQLKDFQRISKNGPPT